jgi:hypothetical protein
LLLMGPPGTGKTLLARAIAGEAGVPFFTISGSDFVEMFVGVGASRVRDLFCRARKTRPASFSSMKSMPWAATAAPAWAAAMTSASRPSTSCWWKWTAFESNEGVILISATNRPDVLDPALLRPGRFDRQVVVSLPDIRGREKIPERAHEKDPVAKMSCPSSWPRARPGFSGADLENLVNEAALLAAKRGKEKLEMVDFEDAKDKVYMGLERKSKVIKRGGSQNHRLSRGRPCPGGAFAAQHRRGEQNYHHPARPRGRCHLVPARRTRFQIQGSAGKRTGGGFRRASGRRAGFRSDQHRRVQRYQSGHRPGPANDAQAGA